MRHPVLLEAMIAKYRSRDVEYMSIYQENQMVEPNVVLGERAMPAPGSSGPVKPLRLVDGDGIRMEFRPADDITTLELAALLVLLFKLTLSKDVIPPDWKGYLAEHGLGRHFVTIEPNEDVGA